MSNSGTVAAVGSPFADVNAIASSQVTMYELNMEGRQKPACDIEGEEGEELGSSLCMSHDGTRIAIGSPKYGFEGAEKCVKILVLHKN